MLSIWLGPVVWIGVAMFEEISSEFFLNCLWKLGSHQIWAFIRIWPLIISHALYDSFQILMFVIRIA